MLLFYTDDFTFEMDKSYLVVEESLVLLQPPLLSSSEKRLGCFLKALSLLPHLPFLHVLLLSPKFLLGGYCMHWG